MSLDWAERALEGLVEGVFTRPFRARIHPRQIAQSLTRRLEEGKVVSLRRVYAPNSFIVRLNARDLTTLAPFQAELSDEMERHLADWVAQNRYHLCGPVRVTFEASDRVRVGGVRCEVGLDPSPPVAGDESPTIMGGALFPDDDPRVPAARLVALDGPLRGRAFELNGRVITLGRAPDNSLMLADYHLSRSHARIELAEHGFVLIDLDSRNGTFVGGRRVSRHPLEPGDRIQMGSSLLEFQQTER
jgi:hypothetical protein